MVNRKAEGLLASELHDALEPLAIGDPVPESEHWREALVSLEFWWPTVNGWEEESLDGFDILEAKKVAPGQVHLRGLALLISDQVWTPCAAEIRVDADGRRLASYELYLGQAGDGTLGLDRAAKYGSSAAAALRAQLAKGKPLGPWVFARSSGHAAGRV